MEILYQTGLSVSSTSVSDLSVSRWQVPLSVSPSGHSWTINSTKRPFTGKDRIEKVDGLKRGCKTDTNTQW